MRLQEEAALDTARGLVWHPHMRRELSDALAALKNGEEDQIAKAAALLFELQLRGELQRLMTPEDDFEAEFEALRRGCSIKTVVRRTQL